MPKPVGHPLGALRRGDACGWKGRTEELLGYHFDSGFASSEAILQAFARDINLLLRKSNLALELGRLLLKWGFVTKVDARTLTRYVAAFARGVLVAVLEEREKIAKEDAHAAG